MFPWDPRPARRIKKRRRATTNKGWTNTQKEMRGDEVLVAVTGLASGTRGQYVRGVWQYIKANHLQTPNDGRRIIPDATLARLMGIEGQQFNAFTMLRYIERHLLRNEAGNETAWRIQTIWEKLIPLWLLNIFNWNPSWNLQKAWLDFMKILYVDKINFVSLGSVLILRSKFS